MGVLIVLLVIMVQHGRVQANEMVAEQQQEAAEQAEALAKQREEEAIELEDKQWRNDLLATQRTEVTDQLDRSRAELGYLEQSIRDMRGKVATLVEQAGYFEQTEAEREAQSVAAVARYEQLEQQIAAAKADYKAAETKAKKGSTSYAIVMHDVQGGTRRKPIYVECTAGGIIVQPEGIVLTPLDFQGPMPPGNPLDAALLAVKAYYERFPETADTQPYPLLLVRPSGTNAYDKARAAMRSWDDRFGYELIDQNMQLSFPEPDPGLKAVLLQAVRDARMRQMRLAAQQPARYQDFIKHTLSGAAADGLGGGDGLGPGGRSNTPGAGIGDGTGSRQGVGFSNNTASTGSGQGIDQGTGQGSLAQGSRGPGTPGQVSPNQGSFAQGGTGPPTASGPYGRSEPPRSPGEAANGTGFGGADSAQSAGQQYNPSQPAGQFAANGSPNGNPNGQSPGGAPAGQPGQAQGQPGQPGQQGGGAGGSGGAAGIPCNCEPIAATAGRDWGLRGAKPSATAITRPIQVSCEADRLILLPEQGLRMGPQTVVIGARPEQAAADFVKKVWSYMDTWGQAGASAYWRPILRVRVAPGAEARFVEFQRSLQGSGLVIERKNP